MKVLFLTLYPEIIASSRYRVHQYIPFLEKEGIACAVRPAVSLKNYLRFHKSRNITGRIYYQCIEFLKRVTDILNSTNYDIVFVQKGLLSLRLKGLVPILAGRAKRIIFDFDDFVHLCPPQELPGFLSCLEDKNQLPSLIKHMKHVVAGNRFLRDYALLYNRNVTIIPTPIDTERFFFQPKEPPSKKVTIGWIGSSNTLGYLKLVEEPLREISRRHDIYFKVISDQPPQLNAVPLVFRKWEYEEEVAQLQDFDIGVMPLSDDAFARGKCSLKALQYMAVGAPCVLSPVGMNADLVKQGIDGFFADSAEDWIEKLGRLIEDRDLRLRIALAARKKVEDYYSLKVCAPKLKRILEDTANV